MLNVYGLDDDEVRRQAAVTSRPPPTMPAGTGGPNDQWWSGDPIVQPAPASAGSANFWADDPIVSPAAPAPNANGYQPQPAVDPWAEFVTPARPAPAGRSPSGIQGLSNSELLRQLRPSGPPPSGASGLSDRELLCQLGASPATPARPAGGTPTFEVQGPNGQIFEVEAPNERAAVEAFRRHAGGTQPPAAPSDADPWVAFDPKPASALVASPVQTYDAMGNATGMVAASSAPVAMPYSEQMRKVGGVLVQGARVVDDLVRQAANGATLGVADKFAAKMDALTGRAASYDDALRAERARTADYAEVHPVPAFLAHAAGGAAGMTAAAGMGLPVFGGSGSLFARAARGATATGGLGAVAGAVNADGDALAAATSARDGALTQGLIGAAGPLAGAALSGVVGAAARPFMGRLAPEAAAQSQVARALQNSGRSADEVADAMALAASEGQPMFTAADAMGNAGQRALVPAVKAPGPGRTGAVEFLERRQAGQGERLTSFVEDAFDARQTAASAAAAYEQAAQRAALDAGVRAATRGRIDDVLPTFTGLSPEGQAAFRTGYADPLIARIEAPPVGANKARPFTSDRAQAILPEVAVPGRGEPLMRQLDREGTMYATRGQALGGSTTSENLADMAGGLDPVALGRILMGDTGGLIHAGLSAAGRLATGSTEASRAALARALLSTDAEAFRTSATQQAIDAAKRQALAQALARSVTSAGAGAYQASR